MKNRRIVVTAVLVALLALIQMTSLGQGRGMRSPEERAKQLKEQLALTDSQTVKVKMIFEDGQKTMSKMMDSGGDRETMRKVFTDMAAKQDTLIEKLLTKEQLKKYADLKKERQERMQQPRRSREQ